MFPNGLNMGLLLYVWVKNIVHGVKTYRISSKENILGTVVSKNSAIGYERTHHYWFPWKRCYCKQCFLLPIPLQENVIKD